MIVKYDATSMFFILNGRGMWVTSTIFHHDSLQYQGLKFATQS